MCSLRSILRQLMLFGFCWGASFSAAQSTSQRRLLARHRVSVYRSSTSGFLDPVWDAKGPDNLERQLKRLSLDVARADGQPNFHREAAPAAYVVPVGSGDTVYTDVEDVSTLVDYVKSGGLVVVHDSLKFSEATQEFVARILGYEGDWQHCELITDNARSALSDATLTDYAREFLSGSWPSRLEDARDIQVRSWCKHSDNAAVSYPLYTLNGDPMQAVAQAFSKVGVPGAVVWLGYSWRDGPKTGWGALLGHIIRGFATGAYQAPSDSSFMDRYPLRLDNLFDSAASIADDTAEAIRRFLSSISLPSGRHGSGQYGNYGYGCYGQGYGQGYGYGYGYYGDCGNGYGYYSPPANAAPAYPPPSVNPTPVESVPPPSAPSPVNYTRNFVKFSRQPATGTQGLNGSVVWYDDLDYTAQLNLQPTNSKLWLVDRLKRTCHDHSPCRGCDRAWQPPNTTESALFPSDTLVLYFREPVQLKTILIHELRGPGIFEVFLLQWPAVPIPSLGLNTTRVYDDVTPSDLLHDWTFRRTPCGGWIDVAVPPSRSGMDLHLPDGYNQTTLPPRIEKRAVGGVGIRMYDSNGNTRRPQIGEVRFTGRVLYPSSTTR